MTLAFDSTGKATAVWVRQGNRDFRQNSLRLLMMDVWDPATGAWTVSGVPGARSGALMPAISFTASEDPVLAYAVGGTDADGVTATGLGKQRVGCDPAMAIAVESRQRGRTAARCHAGAQCPAEISALLRVYTSAATMAVPRTTAR